MDVVMLAPWSYGTVAAGMFVELAGGAYGDQAAAGSDRGGRAEEEQETQNQHIVIHSRAKFNVY